jgi:hypothetical protein
MTAPQRAQADEAPDDPSGMPVAAGLVILMIGVAGGVIVVLFLASMHAAGTGRGLW